MAYQSAELQASEHIQEFKSTQHIHTTETSKNIQTHTYTCKTLDLHTHTHVHNSIHRKYLWTNRICVNVSKMFLNMFACVLG